ncbi:hypothetical protein FIBSPDRAFT_795986 [Athelia psychrophila]|uniref:Uncharacterized protein n=1 Tax=Athelia psychrophila TaxID=1759441 RepID=A0A166DWV0_9AGAM|nr:hypothetical protein FIBSPDRAFT_795986 [Fibularhizoctonia sp. CBS 109695]
MKSLRKSLNGGKDQQTLRHHISTPLPLPSVSKPSAAISPPQKVIRALSDYRPQAPQELPFQKGDFFYVVRDVDNQGAWYEAHNPVSGARGLVQRSMFEEFNKNPTPIRTSQVLSPTVFSPGGGVLSPSTPNTPSAPKTQVFYAVVLHDFVAERADELDAKAGDPISVVAQSNREWFVAKPIGKLGRPGLIPVTFVEVRDPASNLPIRDIDMLMDRGDLPRVEDWKRAVFNYKASSIPLGTLDDPNGRESVVPNSPYMPQRSPSGSSNSHASPTQPPHPSERLEPPPRTPSPTHLPPGILLAANVVSFHYEMDEYWFRIDATYQPIPPTDAARPPSSLPSAKQLVLFRVYNDFYDFQVSLLNNFPKEAGREPPAERILPYMPGPAQQVDDEITATRRAELDEYLHRLCELSGQGARAILEHEVVRDFCALKPGDVEHDVEPKVEEIEALYGFKDELLTGNGNGPHHYQDYESEVRDTLGSMALGDNDEEPSDGSDYEDPYAHTQRPSLAAASHSSLSLRQQAHTQNHQNHQRSGSSMSAYQAQGGGGPYAHEQPSRTGTPSSSHSHSHSHSQSHSKSPSIAPSSKSHSLSRSHSNAGNLNTPSISAANSQTAFVKIKIFDRLTDDLIALRVHPRVSHGELMDKVQARLGGAVSHLSFRDSLDQQFIGVDGDDALTEWMEGTDKHVLYAD